MIVERLLYFLANGVFMGAQRPLYCMVVPSEFNGDMVTFRNSLSRTWPHLSAARPLLAYRLLNAQRRDSPTL